MTRTTMRLTAFAAIAAFAAFGYAAAQDTAEPSALELLDGVLERCLTKDELDVCLQEEAAGAIGRALNVEDIPLAPGLSLTKSPSYQPAAESEETGRSEPMSPYEKIWDNLDRLISSRSLSFNLNEFEEGRKKKKRFYRYFAVAAATAAAILIPIKLKFIAWMAATALMIGKVALVVASLVGLKKLVSKPHEETTHVHYDGHRSDDAHFLAYSGQQPNTIE